LPSWASWRFCPSAAWAFGAVGYTVRADRAPSAATERFLAALRAVGERLGRGR
jgi:hypothetical protein